MGKVAVIGVFGLFFILMLALMVQNMGRQVSAESVENVKITLELARGEYPGFAEDVERQVKEKRISLVEIGTNSHELEMLKRLGKLKEAKTTLNLARTGSFGMAEDLEKMVEENKISLEEIGTSQDELKKLKRFGEVKEAKTTLNLARTGSFGMAEDLEKMVEENKISLEEIGTSQDELKKLKRLGKIKNAKASLNLARGEYPFFVHDLGTTLEGTDITLEEIGTSLQEIKELQKKAADREREQKTIH